VRVRPWELVRLIDGRGNERDVRVSSIDIHNSVIGELSIPGNWHTADGSDGALNQADKPLS
jgi:hypothetical protein